MTPLSPRTSPDARATSLFLFATHAAPGGIRELWESLEEGLKERGYDAALHTLYRHRLEDEEGAAPSSRWAHITQRPLPGPLGLIQSALALMVWLRRTRPDVIISAMPVANILLAWLTRLFSPATRIIETHHTPVQTYHPLLRRLARANGAAATVAAVVCVSRSVADSLAPAPPSAANKHLVIPNAASPAIARHLAGLAREREGRPHGRTLCAIGRLTEQKNFATLIRAAALMPDVRVEIIGGDPDEEALAALIAAENLEDRVHLLGQRPREETLRRLSQADIFVQISRWEGHSLALIEAAMIGLPLIVSDVPVQIEGITRQDGTQCGSIVGVDNAAEIAEKAQMLLDDPSSYRLWSDLARSLGRDHDFGLLCARYAGLIDQARADREAARS